MAFFELLLYTKDGKVAWGGVDHHNPDLYVREGGMGGVGERRLIEV